MTARICVALSLTAFLATSTFAVSGKAGELAERRQEQRKRIREGVKDGKISKQTAQQDRAAIHQDAVADRSERQANGGKLTPQERQQSNEALNANSKNIYAQKHPGGAAPGAPPAPAPAPAPAAPPSGN